MKQTVRTSRTAGYLEKIFRAVNDHYFGGAIEEPIITIQSTPRAYGHVTVAKTWSKGSNGERRHELNIGAGTLDRPIEAVVTTLIHECVHLDNLQKGIQDCSRGGTYHNKRFKVRAEECGLSVAYDSRIGWSLTSPTDELLDFILEQGWTEIRMSRNDGVSFGGVGGTEGTTAPTVTKKPSSTRKLQCPCCGNSVRATKAVRIMCMDCMQQMTEV